MRIVIIGAGVLGASAAFHLARSGARVTVIDAHLDGRATAAGAGIICPWVSGVEDEAFYRLYVSGGEYYPELITALAEAGETDFGYRRVGALLVSGDKHELAWIERMARQRAAVAMGMSPACPQPKRGGCFHRCGRISAAFTSRRGAGRRAASDCRPAAGGRIVGRLDLARTRRSGGGSGPGRCCGRRR